MFASNLKALVCPFSRYTLSTFGMHSREFPWKTQGWYYVTDTLFWLLEYQLPGTASFGEPIAAC